MQGLIGIYLRYRLRVKYGQYVKAVREEQVSDVNAPSFIKTNPQLAVSVLKDPNTAIAASATLAQILLPLYQWKGAPNVEVKMPNNPKTYRWAGQNFGNVSRLYQTDPVSSIRTQNTAQIKTNFRPIYATERIDLNTLCQEAKSVMNQYGQ